MNAPPPLQEILSQTVFSQGANVAFGSLTVGQARERSDELHSAVGWGPTARVASVARAWRELTMVMERAGVLTVAELDPELVVDLAPRLWIVPPGGGLLA